MDTKIKSAKDILSSMINSKYQNENYQERQTKLHYELLDEVLTKTLKESQLLRHLVSDFKNEMIQGVSHSPFPIWIRKIAYCLVNPDFKLSNDRVQLIRNYCAEVCYEFINGKDFGTTKFLAENDEFDFLSKMAKAMLR